MALSVHWSLTTVISCTKLGWLNHHGLQTVYGIYIVLCNPSKHLTTQVSIHAFIQSGAAIQGATCSGRISSTHIYKHIAMPLGWFGVSTSTSALSALCMGWEPKHDIPIGEQPSFSWSTVVQSHFLNNSSRTTIGTGIIMTLTRVNSGKAAQTGKQVQSEAGCQAGAGSRKQDCKITERLERRDNAHGNTNYRERSVCKSCWDGWWMKWEIT